MTKITELQELFVMFETGNLLLLLNQYETAAKCFDQIGFRLIVLKF